MKKRRHHYIWREYLRAWAENESIWCSREGKVFKSNLMGIGQIRDFYKLNELSIRDIEIIHKIAIEQTQPHLQELNKNWIKLFTFVFHMRNLFEKKGIDDLELNNLLDETIYNFEEDLHSRIENDAIKYIKLILSEDIEFYSTDKGFLDFTHYICIQYMRTQKIKSNVLANVSSIKSIDAKKIWNVLSHIFATNIACSIYTNRQSFKMILLKNRSTKELITGDQPIINTYAVCLESTKVPEELEFYYPVSPWLAILITKNEIIERTNELVLSEVDVVKYNQMIVDQSHSQIYAASENVLREYEK